MANMPTLPVMGLKVDASIPAADLAAALKRAKPIDGRPHLDITISNTPLVVRAGFNAKSVRKTLTAIEAAELGTIGCRLSGTIKPSKEGLILDCAGVSTFEMKPKADQVPAESPAAESPIAPTVAPTPEAMGPDAAADAVSGDPTKDLAPPDAPAVPASGMFQKPPVPATAPEPVLEAAHPFAVGDPTIGGVPPTAAAPAGPLSARVADRSGPPTAAVDQALRTYYKEWTRRHRGQLPRHWAKEIDAQYRSWEAMLVDDDRPGALAARHALRARLDRASAAMQAWERPEPAEPTRRTGRAAAAHGRS